ncbi:MAG: ATP-binding cassette domain-containing protein [Oscillospiraceae bacterium]
MSFYFYDTEIESKENAVCKSKDEFKGDIEFSNVSLSFDETTILKDINLKINHGETVAIMGETGAGKTMLINAILRLYDVKFGSLKIDGIDVRDWDLLSLRSKIGVATQDVFLFSDTVEGNIAYGNQDLTFEEVVKIANQARATFIENMDDGYDTIIGERGVGLSGGQKQRLALARALAIKPSILILDDTTSAVDVETEKHIQENLDNLDFQCTKIIIAQRISSVKNADIIIIIDNGAIKEQGTHAQLIALKGLYFEFYKIQSNMEV